MTFKGSCACSAVSYTLPEDPDAVHACYCSTCQKWSGGILTSIKGGKNPVFQGQENISTWTSSAWAERAFCKTCGSSIYYKVTAPGPMQGDYHFCAGTLDDYKDLKMTSELFIDCKPNAFEFKTDEGHETKTRAEVFAAFS